MITFTMNYSKSEYQKEVITKIQSLRMC